MEKKKHGKNIKFSFMEDDYDPHRIVLSVPSKNSPWNCFEFSFFLAALLNISG